MSKIDIYSQYISRQQYLLENSLVGGQKLISEREMLINLLMAEGFTSKQIEYLLEKDGTGIFDVAKAAGSALYNFATGRTFKQNRDNLANIAIEKQREREQAKETSPVSAMSGADDAAEAARKQAEAKAGKGFTDTPERAGQTTMARTSSTATPPAAAPAARPAAKPSAARPSGSSSRSGSFQAAKRAIPSGNDPGATAIDRLNYMANRGNKAAQRAVTSKSDWKKDVFER